MQRDTRRGLLLGGLALAAAAALAAVTVPSGRAALSAAVGWLSGSGAAGRLIAFAGAVVAIPLGVPTLWTCALIGYLFGAVAGPPMALAAALGGAVIAFSLCRWLVLDWVERAVARRRRWRAIAAAVGGGGARLVALLRLAGPHNILNVALAASPISLRQFVAGTLVGSVPSVTLAALGGALAGDAASLWRSRDQLGPAWFVVLVAGGLALAASVFVMVRATRRALASTSPYTDVVSPGAPLIRHSDEMEWEPSPSPTVLRKRLELTGPAEAGRVTSVVRYLPGSAFHAHPHPDGEEILVLEGVFTDQTGDHSAGSYLLNPEGFEHAPSSRAGCTLFVKLRQYAGERETVRIDSTRSAWSPHPSIAGVEVLELYHREPHPESMRLVRISAGAEVPTQPFPRGEEIFVLDGSFSDEHGEYRAGSWVRYPPGTSHTPRTESGCTIYVKKDHLAG